MDINQLVKLINPKCSFVPSLIRQELDLPKIYTFFHIPKCGGLDFEGSYRTALQYFCSINKKPIFIDRADTEIMLQTTLGRLKKDNEEGNDIRNIRGIFSSHLGIKRLSIEKLIPMNHLITILRNPVDRLISAFCYDCMRDDRQPDLDTFGRFIKEQNNINQISLLLDKGNNTNDTIENNIRDTFFACIDIESSKSLLGELLSRNMFPNAIKENLNTTLPEYKIQKQNIPDKIIRTIKNLNAKDIDFYNRFKHNPVMPQILKKGKGNINTMLIADNQTQKKSDSKAILVNTDPFINFLIQNQSNLPKRLKTLIQIVLDAEK